MSSDDELIINLLAALDTDPAADPRLTAEVSEEAWDMIARFASDNGVSISALLEAAAKHLNDETFLKMFRRSLPD